MSDNEDLLGDDLGDTLHEYSLGNEDEDLLLAGDEYVFEDKNNVQSENKYVDENNILDEEISDNSYETSVKNNVISSNIYEHEFVVGNITVEVKNQTFVSDNSDIRQRRCSSSSAAEVPGVGQLDVNTAATHIQPQRDIVDSGKGRLEVRFHSEKPVVAHKTPQVRNIPDSLDQVYIPGGRAHGVHPSRPPRQTSWRNPHYQQPPRPNLYKKVINNMGPVLPTPQTRPSLTPPQNQTTVSPTQQIQKTITNTSSIPPQVLPLRQNHPEVHKNEPNFNPSMQHTQIFLHNNEQQTYPNQMAPLPRHEFQLQNTITPNQMPPTLKVRPNIPQITFQNPQVGPLNDRPFYSTPPPPIRPHFQNVQYQRFPPPQYVQRPPPFNQMGHRVPNMVPRGPNMVPRGPNMVPIGLNMVPIQQNMGQVRVMPPIVRHVITANNTNLEGAVVKNEFARSDLTMDGPPGVDSSEFSRPPREQEVRMMPLQHIGVPSTGFPGKKVHINPHFKGNIQPRIDGPPTYVPTRIERPSSPLPPYGRSVADVDDAAERFIAEQRSALAKAAARKLQARRSPQRYIENTTIEIENDLAGPPTNPPPPGDEDQDLLRRQEEFIHANRAGLRRRMRTPSPPPPPPRRRSPSPTRRRSPSPSWRRRAPLPPLAAPVAPAPAAYKRRREADTTQPDPEESEYRRKLREQENMRERVLRAKEARRRKHAVVLQKQIDDREREKVDKERQQHNEAEVKQSQNQPASTPQVQEQATQLHIRAEPQTAARGSPPAAASKEDPSKHQIKSKDAVRSPQPVQQESKAKPLLEVKQEESMYDDDALDLFLEELDGVMLEDEHPEESGRFKVNEKLAAKSTKPISDLRSKLPPRAQTSSNQSKAQTQERKKIVFDKPRVDRKKNEEPQSPNATQKRKMAPTTNAPPVDRSLTPPFDESKFPKQVKIARTQVETNVSKPDNESNHSRPRYDRQRITFANKQVNENPEAMLKPAQETVATKSSSGFSNRRVVLQRSTNKTEEKQKPLETRLEKPSKTSVFQRIDNVCSESNASRDPTKPTAGIFSRAMRTAIGVSTSQAKRLVVKKRKESTPEPILPDNEPKVEFAKDSSDEDLDSLNEELLLRDEDEDILNEEISKNDRKKNVPERKNAVTDRFLVKVENLPYGMTEMRLSTLAGSDVQSVSIDKERRSARVQFRAIDAAKTFLKKFNNKMVAASRLTVTML